MKYKRICQHCGKQFKTDASARKYCSDACSQEAERLKRNERNRKYTRARNELEKEEKELQRQKRNAELKKEDEQKQKKREKELRQKVKAGDPFAIMQTHTMYDVEYWEAYQTHLLEYYEAIGRLCKHSVNGISIYADRFAEQVVDSVRESKAVFRSG